MAAKIKLVKQAVCLFISTLLFSAIHAQCDSSFFRYTGTAIYDVSLIDTSKMIAVGDNGYIIKSIDGGKSWKNIISKPSTDLINAIQMTGDSVGFAVGNGATILKTEDQGETWFPAFLTYYGAPSFNDLYFFNKQRGYVTGGNACYVTNDGGITWSGSLYTTGTLNSVYFVTDSIGFVCGTGGLLYKTLNGGREWQQVIIPGLGPSESFTKIRFTNPTTGFIISFNGTCRKTVDGGVSWTNIFMPSQGIFSDIYFQNESKGFIVESEGYLLQTDNGGDTWDVSVDYPGTGSLYCINADPSRKKIIFGGGGGAYENMGYNGRNIFSTTDSGSTYRSISSNTNVRYYDAFFLNDSTGYIAGEFGTALKTTDYGETWKPLHNVPAQFSSNAVQSIFFTDSLHGFATTDNVYKTTDGGNSWNITATPGGGSQLSYVVSNMLFLDELKGTLLSGPVLYRTVNGGNSWITASTAPASHYYYDFTYTSSGKGFAVGSGGFLSVSADEGATWNAFNMNTTTDLRSVYFYDNNIGYIGTNGSTIFKTTDGGNNWTTINAGMNSGAPMRSIRFTDALTGYVVCYDFPNSGTSAVYKTKDGGLTWFSPVSAPLEPTSRIAGLHDIYIAGGTGLIIKLDSLQKPGLPGYIYGPDKACLHDKSSFITPAITGVNYNWTLSGGGINTPVENKDTIFWNSTGQYNLSLSVENSCGVSASRTISIEVIEFQPVITVVDSVLTATAGLTYQWYKNSVAINGATAQSYIATQPGSYTVQVKSFYGCTITTPATEYAGLPAYICAGGNTTISSSVTATAYQWQRDTGAGYGNIINNSFYNGTNTAVLQLTSIPSSWYGYKFRCYTNQGVSNEYVLRFTNKWTGAAGNAWENPLNWSCGTVPDENTDVIIESGTVIISSNVTIRTLVLNPSVTLTVSAGNTLTITH